MSLKVRDALATQVDISVRGTLGPKLKKLDEAGAIALANALMKAQQPNGYSRREWTAMLAVAPSILEQVTGSTPLPEPTTAVSTGWTGNFEKFCAHLRTALPEDQAIRITGVLGVFAPELRAHQIDALMKQSLKALRPELRDALGRGGYLRRVLNAAQTYSDPSATAKPHAKVVA